MKKKRGLRRLSLLLALAMCLTFIPAARAEGETITITEPEGDSITLKEGSSRTLMVTVTDNGRIAWESGDKTIASVNNVNNMLTGNKAGKTTVYAFLQSDTTVKSRTLNVTVSGIAVPEVLEIDENQPYNLMNVAKGWCVGDADPYTLEFSSLDTYILEVDGDTITGLREGDASVELRSNDGAYVKTLKIRVNPDPYNDIQADTITTDSTLSFADLDFSKQIGGKVQYITGLFVPTDQGTLYYDYRSESEPGRGVGQIDAYYRSPGPGQWALNDVTFVPKSSYPGGKVTITYTAVTEEGLNRACKIIFTIEGSSGSSSIGGISYNTEYGAAVQFESLEFGTICREKLGVQLDHVVFSQPPERQGALYTNYASANSYGSLVDVHRQYSRRELDDVWFVPAPGYSGDVTVYYTGFGTNGRSYSGQVFIKVEQEDSVATGGLSYNTSPGRAARFDDDDFDDYCYEILGKDNSQTLSAIRFESLPAESQGVLYYDYQSSVNTGVRAEAGIVYYYGSRTPRIDRLAFVPAEDFTGVLKLPFTGWTMDGTSFSGNVEINVRGGATSGDIYYYCLPGGSVSFLSSDFTSLSRTLTDRTLDYIRFLGLPDTSEGSLFYNNARVSSTGTSYTSGNVSRLSFRAAKTFSGLVNIPFEGRSTGGNTFSGVISIGDGSAGSSNSNSNSSSSNNSSSLSSADVTARYSTRTEPIWFYSGDLALSGSSLSSVRFTSLPSSGAGYLYYQYASPTRYGQQVSTGTTYQASGGTLISDLAFVPRAGYAGTVTIPYTGTNSNGSTFTGEVLITVSPSYSSYYFSDMAGYDSAQMAAVDFLYDHSITHGMAAGQYGPENPIRRGDFALMLYQAFEFYPISYGESFTDVSPDAYYATAVDTLYARGVVSGVGSGRYAPESTLTRQDAVCMVQRAMQTIGWSASDGYAGTLAGYSDSDGVSGYAQGAMALAVQRGYLPTAGGWLNPQLPLTRVDMAELLHRVLTY